VVAAIEQQSKTLCLNYSGVPLIVLPALSAQFVLAGSANKKIGKLSKAVD